MSRVIRSQFLADSLLAMAVAAAAPTSLIAADEPPGVAANDKISGAIIGCGIRGKQHASELAHLADCEIAYVCDPDRDRAALVAAQLVAPGRPTPKAVQDLRTVLDDKAVDVVFIAAPNHWHALAAIWAMQAGKDVYVEKPVSLATTTSIRWTFAAGDLASTGSDARSSVSAVGLATATPARRRILKSWCSTSATRPSSRRRAGSRREPFLPDSLKEAGSSLAPRALENARTLAKSPLTLGSLLRIDPEREAFLDKERANALLTREYRRPFVVPAEGEV